jgi:hypothetical protein
MIGLLSYDSRTFLWFFFIDTSKADARFFLVYTDSCDASVAIGVSIF